MFWVALEHLDPLQQMLAKGMAATVLALLAAFIVLRFIRAWWR